MLQSPNIFLKKSRFKRSRVVHIYRLEKGKTINHDLYLKETPQTLVKILHAQRYQSGYRNLKFHHDNARPHVDKTVITFLKVKEFIKMDHQPY